MACRRVQNTGGEGCLGVRQREGVAAGCAQSNDGVGIVFHANG
jgi:hypothetical protein